MKEDPFRHLTSCGGMRRTVCHSLLAVAKRQEGDNPEEVAVVFCTPSLIRSRWSRLFPRSETVVCRIVNHEHVHNFRPSGLSDDRIQGARCIVSAELACIILVLKANRLF